MLSLVDLRERMTSGALTPQGAIRLSEEAIAAREASVGAFVCRSADPVIAGDGPLAGIAVGVKDIIDTADMPTEMGSPIYAGWRPKADAAIVSRLRALGAAPFAKTTTSPFAGLDPTRTRNPHDSSRTPGGSSAGSAAAVAAGMLPLALGAQTGGSVIRPAAFCGIAAIKPSFRLLPLTGVKTFSWALDTLGLFGAGIRDVACALALVAGRPEIDLVGDAPSAFRIGVCLQDFAGEAEADAFHALQRAARAAEAGGANLTDLILPDSLAQAWRSHPIVQDYEARQALAWEWSLHREDLPAGLRAQLDAAQSLTAAAYDDARRSAHRARRALRDVFSDVDAILTFSAPGRAPASLDTTGDPRFNRLWTLMGAPCVNLPIPGDGAPLGVQIVTRFGDDALALAVAAMIERELAR